MVINPYYKKQVLRICINENFHHFQNGSHFTFPPRIAMTDEEVGINEEKSGHVGQKYDDDSDHDDE